MSSSNYVAHQPLLPVAAVVAADALPGQWIEPLCGCFNDCESCLLAWFVPCVLYGRTQEQLNGADCMKEGGTCFLWCCIPYTIGLVIGILTGAGGSGASCHCFYHGPRRRQLREAYGIQPDSCDDCIISWCCLPCAVSQEWREVQARGPPAQQVMSVGSVVPVVAAAPVYAAAPYQQQQPQQQPMYQQQQQPMHQSHMYQPPQQQQQQPQYMAPPVQQYQSSPSSYQYQPPASA